MANKRLTLSLPEAHLWKLGELEKETGKSKSELVAIALLYIFLESPREWKYPMGIGIGDALEELDDDYRENKMAQDE